MVEKTYVPILDSSKTFLISGIHLFSSTHHHLQVDNTVIAICDTVRIKSKWRRFLFSNTQTLNGPKSTIIVGSITLRIITKITIGIKKLLTYKNRFEWQIGKWNFYWQYSKTLCMFQINSRRKFEINSSTKSIQLDLHKR